MPGSIFTLHCHSCLVAYEEIHTGTEQCRDHGEVWQYEQLVCTQCKALQSRQSQFCCREPDRGCVKCGSELEPWAGRVWFDEVEGMSRERIEGPCPRCGTPLSNVGEDGLMAVGSWD